MELGEFKISELDSKGICVIEGDQDFLTKVTYVYTESMKEKRQFIAITTEGARELPTEDESGEELIEFNEEDEETSARLFWYDENSSYDFTFFVTADSEVPFEEIEPQVNKILEVLCAFDEEALVDKLKELSAYYTISSELQGRDDLARITYKSIVDCVEIAECFSV